MHFHQITRSILNVFLYRFFTKVKLIRTLEQNGLYGCGTIKDTANGLPEDIINPRDLVERSDSMQRQHDNLVITSWKYKKVVSFTCFINKI